MHGTRGAVATTGSRAGVVALCLAALAAAALAADRYVCDCATGSDADCVAGDDGAAGTAAAPWRGYEAGRLAFAALAAGEGVSFCRGGAWDVAAGTRWVNGNCMAALPCRVGAYDAAWASGDEARPILRRVDGAHGFALEDGGNAEHEEGYVFSDLDLRGTGGTGNGFFLYNDIDDVTIDNVAIDGFAIGVHAAGANPCSADPECDGRNDRITLVRSTVTNNLHQGWLGGSSGSKILFSEFDGNGSTAVFDHNIYLSGSSGGTAIGMRVIGNRLHGSALDAGGVCQGVSLVVHGAHDDLLIAGNEVWEDLGFAAGGCWGIAVDPGYAEAESFTGVVIRGNVVSDVGNLAIGVAACAGCTIEDNVIVERQAFGATGIAAPDRASGPGDLALDDVVVRNNSIYLAAGGTGILVQGEGDGHVVASNAILYPGTSGSFDCFRADLPTASYVAFDHNVCGHPAAPTAEWEGGSGSLAAWRAATGFDLASDEGDPGFSGPSAGDLRPVSGGAATVDAGHPTWSSPNAIGGFPRDAAPDRGAHEWGVDGLFADGFESGDLAAWR